MQKVTLAYLPKYVFRNHGERGAENERNYRVVYGFMMRPAVAAVFMTVSEDEK